MHTPIARTALHPICLLLSLARSISSSPLSTPSALLPRDAPPTSTGYDAKNLARAGHYYCFTTGGTMQRSIVTFHIDQACSSVSHQSDPNHFSFVPSADGTYPHQQVDHEIAYCSVPHPGPGPTYGCDRTDINGTISFKGDIRADFRADSDTCTYAMLRVGELCHDGNDDTRGGGIVFDGDKTEYSFDVGGVGEA